MRFDRRANLSITPMADRSVLIEELDAPSCRRRATYLEKVW